MSKYSAVIFDLDGTIVDNKKMWMEAFKNTGIKNRINKDLKLAFGHTLEESWKRNGEEERAEKLAIETRTEFIKLCEEADLEPREGFEALVLYLKEKGYLIGLATSSHWLVVDAQLQKLGIEGVFDAMSTGEEVSRAKPDPEIYRLTCQKLGVEPEEVIVFEDTDAGADAAESCGCKVVWIGEGFDFGNSLTELI